MADPLSGLQRLQELWSPSPRQKLGLPNTETFDLPGAGPTIVPHPPQWQPAPEAVGTDVGNALHGLLKIAPGLQGRIGRVQYGPTTGIMDLIDKSNTRQGTHYGPEDLPQLNVMGAHSPLTHDIWLNPATDPQNHPDNGWDAPAVLAHEVTHAAGYRSEKEPEEARALFNLLRSKGTLK